MVDPSAVREALACAHRHDWAFVVAATVRVARDLDVAEESVQDAYAAAVPAWERDGIPTNPAAWLTTTARRRAVDTIRRAEALRTKLPLLVTREEGPDVTTVPPAPLGDTEPEIGDDRLRLIFTCCHPALPQEAQVALTLRLVGGMATRDIALAFLVPEATMAARITRAKKKIAGARIPFLTPAPAELGERLDAVLAVLYLLFTAGHTVTSGDRLVNTELLDRSLHLARTLVQLLPEQVEARGLLALFLATDARRGTRVGGTGQLLRLAEQDRTRWDHAQIAEAGRLVTDILPVGPPGRYTLQAAIAILYSCAPTFADTDWAALLALYDRLLEMWASPVVRLNRTIPLAKVHGAEAALAEIARLTQEGSLAGYHYLHAVTADLLADSGHPDRAATAYRRAIELARNPAETAYLQSQLDQLPRHH